MERRDFLIGTGMTSALAALGWSVGPADAEGLVAARRYRVGAATVHVLSDGYIPLGPEMLNGVTPEEFASLLEAAHISSDLHPTAVNAFLVEIGESKIMIDAGAGDILGPTAGKLPEVMNAIGIDPADIDTVIFTHLHGDHIGGVVSPSGNPFINAALRVASADVDFWTNADIQAQAPDAFKPSFDLARAALGGFGDRVDAFGSGEVSLAPGLTTVPLPGHTVGHTGLMLESEGEALFITADIFHVPAVQLSMPGVTIGFDTDQELARQTRLRTLDMIATDRMMMGGSHVALPGLGHLDTAGDGYRWTTARHQYG
ncbi:MBL fold metallo-hydrolase [Shimia abyssi]|uniref:Glyoxylase-like metal-dependent hydrolase (Beta-lactamase superfamily II) n=1 Tax=Shimia abyssi TaxID=1662395 RepID=A0A2P8FD19_9RHOB|nr:MBL fold metallo-hydrolase [Shimia abyssi]PSL19584.1 glyoxylase-like metal-dependent hydrolase (beta-lactamase superfamily II) [Shimia abyssi]